MTASRRVVRLLVPVVAAFCALAALATVVFIMGVLLLRGLGSIDWSFLTNDTRAAGAEGGIVFQILGTLILVTTALAVAVPPAVALGLTRVVFLENKPRFARAVDALLHALNGVPSIVFGILGLLIFLKFFDWGKSWLAGGILLGVMILPTLAVSLVERLAAVPRKYIEAAAGLGLTREQIIASVWLPQSWPGLVTGSLLGLARAAGETAPILFVTAVFSGATLPTGIRENPLLALPYHIFVLAQDTFHEDARANLWGAALVLVILVACFGLAALPLRLRLHEESRHA
ncbi:MAG: PstA family ABC transporter permease [Verrucomicrobiales bacterium]